MAADKPLISRDELLGGFRGGDKRRAVMALSLIQARAAKSALARGSVRAPFLTEGAFKERNRAYLAAISESAQGAVRVSIQDLERSAQAWEPLVPANPAIRAELAHAIGEAYRFAKARVPGMAAALGLDDPAVAEAYQAKYDRPLSSIYQDRLGLLETLRWTWMRVSAGLESLPPFWTAFALTLTEIVGAGTLALPVAFTTVGPAAGAVLLLVLGLVNLITVGYLAEASARNGSLLYGSAFVGHLVRDFLGPFAAIIVRLTLFCFCCLILVAYFTGFATTLEGISGLPGQVWVIIILSFGVYLILRKSLIGTVASALIVGFVNITILVVLSLIALGYADWERLEHVKVPFLFGEPFDASILQLVFGIVLASYFGHISVSNCAQAVLRREPNGRSLKRGTMAAMLVAIAIYILWSVSISTAVSPERLLSEKGTVLVPLAEQGGGFEVTLLGTIFVLLAMGMGAVHFSLGIFNMAREGVSGGSLSLPFLKRLRFAGGQRLPTVLALIPILLIFAYVEWTFFAGQQSFIKPLELVGVLLTPLLAGLLPVLILISSRRRGRAIGAARLPRMLTNPLLLGVVAILSFAGMVAHGLVIWDDPYKQAAALFGALMLLLFSFDALRRGAFTRQWLIEVRHFPEDSNRADVAVTCAGETVVAELTCELIDGSERKLRSDSPLEQFDRVRGITFALPGKGVSRLEFSAHRVSGDFEAEAIAGDLSVLGGEDDQAPIALDEESGQTRVKGARGPQQWVLRLA